MTKDIKYLLPIGMLVCLGCARELPGPAECRDFAFRALGVDRGSRPSPEEQAGLARVVRQCLTVPYDARLLRCAAETSGTSNHCLKPKYHHILVGCVENTGAKRRCFLDFARRYAARHRER